MLYCPQKNLPHTLNFFEPPQKIIDRPKKQKKIIEPPPKKQKKMLPPPTKKNVDPLQKKFGTDNKIMDRQYKQKKTIGSSPPKKWTPTKKIKPQKKNYIKKSKNKYIPPLPSFSLHGSGDIIRSGQDIQCLP